MSERRYFWVSLDDEPIGIMVSTITKGKEAFVKAYDAALEGKFGVAVATTLREAIATVEPKSAAKALGEYLSPSAAYARREARSQAASKLRRGF